jgi:transposase
MPHWIGLDMGASRTVVCVIDRQGTPLLETECGTTAAEIRATFNSIPRRTIKAIGAEAGTGTHAIRGLISAGLPVRVINPVKASKFLGLNRNKTDSNDARALAEMVRVGRILGAEVHTKSVEAQNIQTLLSLRHNLVRHRLKLEQVMVSALKLNGYQIRLVKGRRSTIEDVLKLDHSASSGISLVEDIVPIADAIDNLRVRTRSLEKRLSDIAMTSPVCQIMMSVPGVGYITALTVYSAIDDHTRFKRLNDVGAYFGLVPNVYQSGNRTILGRISRAGNKAARTHLVSAATSLLYRCRVECRLKSWGLDLLARLGPGKARVALARKLAILLVRLWRTGQRFDPSIGVA